MEDSFFSTIPLATPGMATGEFIRGPLTSGSTATPSNGDLRISPWFLAPGTRLDQLIFEATGTPGGTGSVNRIIIYADNGFFFPGALLYDSGAITTTTAAVFTHSPASAIAMPYLSWVGLVQQGTPSPTSTVRTMTVPVGYVLKHLTSASALATSSTAYLLGGVTGTPASTFPTSGYSLTGLVAAIAARVA